MKMMNLLYAILWKIYVYSVENSGELALLISVGIKSSTSKQPAACLTLISQSVTLTMVTCAASSTLPSSSVVVCDDFAISSVPAAAAHLGSCFLLR